MEKTKRVYGLNLLLSVLVLILEAALALVVSLVYGQTQESPNVQGASGLFVLFLPAIALIGAAVATAISVALVLPTAWLGDVLGRRFGGREAWWWVPSAAGAVSLAVVGGIVALDGGGEPAAVALGWLLTTLALAVPAMICRSRRERIFRPVVLWGLLAVIATGVLGGAALSTGLLKEYHPPAVTSADLVGSWSDGRGGTLTLTADGRLTASGIDQDFDGFPDDEVGFEDDAGSADAEGAGEGAVEGDASCTGQGAWRYSPGTNAWDQEVDISVDTCSFAAWNVGGTESRPALYQYVGDPDGGDTYRLTKTGDGP